MANQWQGGLALCEQLGDKAQGHARLMRCALAITLAMHVSPAFAQESKDGVALELAYTAEVFTGSSKGSGPMVDNLDIILGLTKDDTKLHVYGLYNNGRDFSAPRFPSGYVASNIETGVKAARLYEAWVEQEFAGGKVSVLAGLYDLNSEFDALEASSLFINPAHGIGTDFSQTGANGPSIFPSTSLAVRVQAKPNDTLTLRAAIFDGVPGDPAQPKRTAIKLGKGDGALLAFEADKTLGNWRLIAGHWRYTARFEDELASVLAGVPIERRGNQGFYLRGEGKLNDKLSTFFRFGGANGRFNEVRGFVSGGVSGKGLIAGRSEDETGLAFSWAGAAPRARTLQVQRGDPIARNEWSFEVTYAMKLTEWLTIQPDVQYLINPAFERGRKSLIGGVRAEIFWGF